MAAKCKRPMSYWSVACRAIAQHPQQAPAQLIASPGWRLGLEWPGKAAHGTQKVRGGTPGVRGTRLWFEGHNTIECTCLAAVPMDPFVQPDLQEDAVEDAVDAVGGVCAEMTILPMSEVEPADGKAHHQNAAMVKVLFGQRRLKVCFFLTAAGAVWASVAALELLIAVVTAEVPAPVVMEFMGWTVTYSSQRQGGPLLAQPAVTATVASSACFILVTIAHQLWRIYRIQHRHHDVGLFSWRDAVSYAAVSIRGGFVAALLAAWLVAVRPAQPPLSIDSSAVFRACELDPMYQVVTSPAAVGGTALELAGNVPFTQQCRSRLQFALSDLETTEGTLNGIVPDRGTASEPGGVGSVAYWMRPAGRRSGCSDTTETSSLRLAATPEDEARRNLPLVAPVPWARPGMLRSCTVPSPAARFSLSNWATFVRSSVDPLASGSPRGECDPLEHASHYAAGRVPRHDIEPWVCGLGAVDEAEVVRINYSVAGFTRRMRGDCSLPGEPRFLQSLRAAHVDDLVSPASAELEAMGNVSGARFPRAFHAISALSAQELSTLLGAASAALSRKECTRVAAACTNSSGVITRSLAVQGCETRIVRSDNTAADRQNLQASLLRIRDWFQVLLISAATMFALDCLDLCAVRFV